MAYKSRPSNETAGLRNKPPTCVYTVPDVISKTLYTIVTFLDNQNHVTSPAMAQIVARQPVWITLRIRWFTTESDLRRPLRDFRSARVRKTMQGEPMNILTYDEWTDVRVMRHSTRACIACQITDVVSRTDCPLLVVLTWTPVIDIKASAQCKLPSCDIENHTHHKGKNGKWDDDSTLEATLC
jgi:hypothetical protein